MAARQKIVFLIIILGAASLVFFNRNGELFKSVKPKAPPEAQAPESKDPEVVLTVPNPLSGATILPNQVIEITFNKALHNKGEFKNKIEPKVEYEVQLSDDRKTAKITPTKGWTLGNSFTLTIQPDTKFDGYGDFRKDVQYHFKTIEYRGV